MSKKTILILLLLLTFSFSQTRTYRQTKDISAKANGKVIASKEDENLFEYSYEINFADKIITRTTIKRLDNNISYQDNKKYTITGTKQILTSSSGDGGEAIIAIAEDGNEIIQLAEDIAFTSRGSDFSQMITGIYRRVR